MTTKTADIILVRGLPGAGKTTAAVALGLPVCVAADDYFVDGDGAYNFDPSGLPEAHAWCQGQALSGMEAGLPVVVHNTFTQRWELEPYLAAAARLGLTVEVRSVFDGGCSDEQLAERNTHGVPLAAIQGMRQRWESDWASGNPLPPWER
jgi:predicted kinase